MRQSETQCSNRTTSSNPVNPTNSTNSIPSAGPIVPPGLPVDVPAASELWTVFRESFLFHLDPAAREAMRSAGEVIFAAVLSGDPYRPPEPWTHARLRALARDLLFAVQVLREIAHEPSHSEYQYEDEDRLARSAPAWAEAVERVARLIERAVDEWAGSGEEEA